MANNLSDYLANALQNYVLNGTAFSSPSAGVEIALCTEQPTDLNLHEVTGSGYARKPFTDWTTAPTGSAGVIKNNTAITFTAASGTWDTATHVAIVDGSSNLLYWGALTTPKTLTSGDVFQFDASQLTITLH